MKAIKENYTGVASDAGTGATVSVGTLANGWYRFSVTYTIAAGTSNFDVVITALDGSFVITPAGTEKVFITGTQLRGKRFCKRTTGTIVP